VIRVLTDPGSQRRPGSSVLTVDHRRDVQDFRASRRARLSPEQAGLPSYGGKRRVQGLRREEVAMLAGVSVDYYARLQPGNLAGASPSVLEADDAEREHLLDLARNSDTTPRQERRAFGLAASHQSFEAHPFDPWTHLRGVDRIVRLSGQLAGLGRATHHGRRSEAT
jgi:hypothetical protein